MLAVLGSQAQAVAVGWELYERTHSALALGLTGLASGLPVILLALPGGHVADRFDRRLTVMGCQALYLISAFALAAVSFRHAGITLIYAALAVSGIAAAFNNPARSALLSQIIPRTLLGSAVTWTSSAFLVAAAIGPALGGLIIGISKSATAVYLLNALTALIFLVLISLLRTAQSARSTEKMTLGSLAAGLHFVWKTEVILGAITLDLFAVLFGGATTLLPVFAKDLLHVGPVGLGWLRATPSVGAAITALIIAHRTPIERAGRALLLSVGGFGGATIVFGFSRSIPLSIAMLFTLGALDAISVVIRSNLVQLRTPDRMRGRVLAVNGVFIDTSNELGGLESGVTAWLFGPVISVVAGGLATIGVVLAAATVWPGLRRLGRVEPADKG